MPAAENPDLLLTHLVEAEKAVTCGPQSAQNYLSTHQLRFADILSLCWSQVPDPYARVLDIGRSELTAYLRTFYKNIHTLGFDPRMDDGGHREVSQMETVPHITFDLLSSASVSDWPECGQFDLIVFSEVIEHLHVAPEFVLAFLGSLLSSKGVLICTTPNAADIDKRIRMLLGRNPYERLRLYSLNPGHIREYTRRELVEIAHSVALDCTSHSYRSWSQNKKGIKSLLIKLIRAYPAFRPFQMCVLVKEKTPPAGL